MVRVLVSPHCNNVWRQLCVRECHASGVCWEIYFHHRNIGIKLGVAHYVLLLLLSFPFALGLKKGDNDG